MLRSVRESLNRESRASLKADLELIRNAVLEGEFTYGRERGSFRVVQHGQIYSIYVNFNFNGFPTSMWSQMRRTITSNVVKSASSSGYRVSESNVYFK